MFVLSSMQSQVVKSGKLALTAPQLPPAALATLATLWCCGLNGVWCPICGAVWEGCRYFMEQSFLEEMSFLGRPRSGIAR